MQHQAVRHGERGEYHSVIFVRDDSPITAPEHLKGARMAYVHHRSASGYVFAAAHLGLAGTLMVYGLRPRRRPAPPLVTIGPARRSWTALLLGLFTGVNLCPPFVVAAVRAMETGSVGGAVLFFLAFFAGTAVWFVSLAALGALRVAETVATVARYTMLALAAYYAYLGILTLIGRLLHG